jgi:hypothetical protein
MTDYCLRWAVLPDEMGGCEKRRHTRWYVEHFRNRPERKRLVQIAGENRSP